MLCKRVKYASITLLLVLMVVSASYGKVPTLTQGVEQKNSEIKDQSAGRQDRGQDSDRHKQTKQVEKIPQVVDGRNMGSDLGILNNSGVKREIANSNKFAPLIIQGENLSKRGVERLEKSLVGKPNDLESRIKLLGYYSLKTEIPEAERKTRLRHIEWIIQNHPDSEIAGDYYTKLDPRKDGEDYNQVKRLWLNQVNSYQSNTAVLRNAASFFLISDNETAEMLLKKAQALEPNNPEWSALLSYLYRLEMRYNSSRSKRELAQKFLKEAENILALINSEEGRFCLLSALARGAFEAGELEKARNWAIELLKEASRYKKHWNYGNAIHHGNLILGRLALKANYLQNAKDYLVMAGMAPGSPQLESIGPNMALAKELLERGEKSTVLNYLHLCTKFWKANNKLKDWEATIKGGGTPDFGLNLYF